MAAKQKQKKPRGAQGAHKPIRTRVRLSSARGAEKNALGAAGKPLPGPHMPKHHMNWVWRGQLLTNADVRRTLIEAAGEHAIHVIQEFTVEMSDEDIAKKIKIRASDVRVVLNKLHSFGLASYSRSRDKNSGWYSYVWRLNNERIPQLLEQMKRKGSLEQTRVLPASDAGGNEEYVCKNCGPAQRLPFEEASALLFKCQHCGANLDFFECR